MSQQGQSSPGGIPPPAAAPPTRSEIERKLSFKSAARPTPASSNESPKKNKTQKPNMYISSSQMHAGPSGTGTGNDSDTSSIASSSHPTPLSHPHPHSYQIPQSPNQVSTPGLSSFVERKGSAIPSMLEKFEEEGEEEEEEELELEEDQDQAEGSGSEDDLQGQGQGDLARGMEGERVVKSGYLWKKQERRKAWKKKWFVLRTGKVAYYKDDREYSLKRVIDLKSVHTVAPVTIKKHSFAFGIVTSKRTFLVKASSPDEMEDWVRAVNGCRRKLSEQEEDDRNKREGRSTSTSGTGMAMGASTGMGISIPPRQTPGGNEGLGVDTHQGTYSSVFTNSTSISSSPVATTGYFAPKLASQTQQQQQQHQQYQPQSYSMTGSHSGPTQYQQSAQHQNVTPSSPMDTTNYLTAQMARVSIPQRTPSTSNPQSRSVSSRREPSASSMSSSIGRNPSGPSGGDYLSRSPQPPPLSSDEDEAYFSDPNIGLGTPVVSGTKPTMMTSSSSTTMATGPASASASASGMGVGMGNLVIDPKRIILSAYLMKRSRARGRKVWKKRWFFLTSQGLTYTKSHMDSRPLRHIPLSSVLDALDFESGESSSEADDSDIPASVASGPTRQFSQLGRQTRSSKDGHSTQHQQGGDKPHSASDDHTFRIVTAKRTIVLCAPSEEDEIKWLAAFRALLNRERWGAVAGSGSGSGPMSPAISGVSMEGTSLGSTTGRERPQVSIPYITAQPPTPASQISPNDSPATPSVSTSTGPPVWNAGPTTGLGNPIGVGGNEEWQTQQTATTGLRGRSATFNAKSAVADVIRRYHPEQQGQGAVQN